MGGRPSHVERFSVFVRSSFLQVKVKVKLTLEDAVKARAGVEV